MKETKKLTRSERKAKKLKREMDRYERKRYKTIREIGRKLIHY